MKDFFFKPYPYLFANKRLPKVSFVIFISIFIVVYLFRPFNVNFSEHKFNYLTQCIIQALTASLAFFIYFNLFNFLSQKWKSETYWNLFKETLTVFFATSFMGLGAFLIRNIIYNNPHNVSFKYFVEEVLHAWLVGGVIYSFYTVVNYYRLSSLKYKKKEILDTQQNKSISLDTIPIKTNVKSDNFDLDLSKFLIAKADGNYVEIYLETSGEIDKKLVRLSLKDLEKQLRLHTFITRTHRKFLVNTKKIENVSGNTLGYELDFDKLDFQVPVSRGNIKKFDFVINQI